MSVAMCLGGGGHGKGLMGAWNRGLVPVPPIDVPVSGLSTTSAPDGARLDPSVCAGEPSVPVTSAPMAGVPPLAAGGRHPPPAKSAYTMVLAWLRRGVDLSRVTPGWEGGDPTLSARDVEELR